MGEEEEKKERGEVESWERVSPVHQRVPRPGKPTWRPCISSKGCKMHGGSLPLACSISALEGKWKDMRAGREIIEKELQCKQSGAYC